MSNHDQEQGGGFEFQSLAGFRYVYQPQRAKVSGFKRHPCKDCHFCQGCSETRCQACRDAKKSAAGRGNSRLSVREQIALYEQLNSLQPNIAAAHDETES